MPAVVPLSIWQAALRLATGESWPPPTLASARAFVEEARTNGLLPLLFADDAMPPVVAEALREIAAARFVYLRRAQVFAKLLQRIADVADGEEMILLKGSEYRH